MTPSPRAILEGHLQRTFLRSAGRALGAKRRVHRSTDGRKTPYLELGRGNAETLVFLHGFSDRPEHFLATAAFLRDRFRILVPAMPGFHEGHLDTTLDHGFESYSAWLSDVVSDIAPSRFHLMGNSLGGATALGVAERLATRVASLTLVDAAGVQIEGLETTLDRVDAGAQSHFDVRTRGDLDRYLAGVAWRPLPVFSLVREYLFCDLHSKREWYVKIGQDLCASIRRMYASGRDSHVDLAALRIPTLVVWGEHDSLFPVALAERIAERMPRAEARILAGVGHCPHLESPYRLAKEFEAFVNRLESFESAPRERTNGAALATAP